jgi:hypothetical protein
VIIIDTAERIDAFLPQVEEVLGEGLAVLDDVDVALHRFRSPDRP